MHTLKGLVVSNKMQKTVVVETTIQKTHPKYRKTYMISRRLKAHDEEGICKVGDMVVLAPTRPLSKEKRWKVIERKAGEGTVKS